MGVSLDLPMHHLQNGLFFQPQPDGSVRVMLTNGENPLATGANLRGDVTISQDSFISGIAACCEGGDTGARFDAIREAMTASVQRDFVGDRDAGE